MKRLVLLLLLIASPLGAQAPHEEWRTIETAHFRVHFPRDYEAWSTRAASRLESIRAAVVREVGFDPPQKVDVLVMNPNAAANGFAIPLLDSPRLVLFTEPPPPESEIGDYSNWIDLLSVHEVTHLVHLLRPSRNPLQGVVERFLPIGPISLGAPRWVSEGYATVIEGRLTGAGRPGGAIREAVLRKWAATGRFPTYGELNSSRRFMGMSMAYLAGSAFLEWLEERHGPESLRKVWRRMSARQRRGFNEAFIGVFGERPERLYGRFVAELTARAAAPRESVEQELWQETSHLSGDPAVSPDGKQIALVLRERERPSRLVIWSTEAPSEEEKKQEERIRKMLERDPEDVAPDRSKPLPRKMVHTLTMPSGGDIESPRWMPDGTSLLFTHRQRDADGFLHRDLFRWTPASGRVDRLTFVADLSDADPQPKRLHAVAIRNRFGSSQLVDVDLATGEVRELTPPSLERVYSHPRVSRDGSRVVYALHEQGAWRLAIRDLATGAETIFPGISVASPEWSGDAIYATLMTPESIDIYKWSAAVLVGASRLTSTIGGAFSPAPAPDGRVFFMSLEPDGFVIRVAQWGAGGLAGAAPASRRRPTEPFAEEKVSARPYRIRPELTILTGGFTAPAGDATEIGLRAGDVVGQLDLIALGSFGRAASGASLAAAWRGWPVALSAHLFRADEEGEDYRGAEMRATWDIHFPLQRLRVDGGVLTGERDLFFASAALGARQARHNIRFEQDLRLAAEKGDEASHVRGVARGAVIFGQTRVALRLQHDRSSERSMSLGGVAPSVLPASLLADRILDPALPRRLLEGDRYSGARLEAGRGRAVVFIQEHRMSGRIRTAGVELRLSSDPNPLLKLPAFDLSLGAARVLQGVLRGETGTWLALRWHP